MWAKDVTLPERVQMGSSYQVRNLESFRVGEQQNTTERCSFSFEAVLYGTPELSYDTFFYYIGWLCHYI